MKSLDTSVLVRYYAADDKQQHAAVVAMLKKEAALFVPKAVVQELWWVLTKVERYKFEDAKVRQVISHLAGIHSIILEDAEEIMTALEFQRKGIGFADALHLAASSGCTELLTFDNKLAKRANMLGLKPTCIVPGRI